MNSSQISNSQINNTNMNSNIKNELLKKMCIINTDNNQICLNYTYFKQLLDINMHDEILLYCHSIFDTFLENNDKLILNVDVRNLNINIINKHYDYICYILKDFKEKYPDKLDKCFVYNPPFVFAQLYKIICFIIDKETQKKIIIVKNKII
jgi:hypothetical protein